MLIGQISSLNCVAAGTVLFRATLKSFKKRVSNSAVNYWCSVTVWLVQVRIHNQERSRSVRTTTFNYTVTQNLCFVPDDWCGKGAKTYIGFRQSSLCINNREVVVTYLVASKKMEYLFIAQPRR